MKLLGETMKSTKKISKTPKSPSKRGNNKDEERRAEAKSEKENITNAKS